MNGKIDEAVAALNARMTGAPMEGSAKFVVPGEGAIIVDGSGARASDEAADVTLTADAEVFRAIIQGDVDPAGAYLRGKLSVEGDVSVAMRLGRVLG
ncbi:SCP2 sterol-binding domain-containing protein [Roseovarius aquimarinus]|uniref:SCP2 sterol-binding domain-containing protein n=1 Tax=Roseovarius aquimarinus TaxID=1229156 RepID=A0ABW7I5M8_9RHOB